LDLFINKEEETFDFIFDDDGHELLIFIGLDFELLATIGIAEEDVFGAVKGLTKTDLFFCCCCKICKN